MKIIEQSFTVIAPSPFNSSAVMDMYRQIEAAGRTCYKSESTEFSASRFVKKLAENHHEAMLEHASISIRFITSRAVSHELVRHRMASFAQLSQRYVNYSKDKFGHTIPFIRPTNITPGTRADECFLLACQACENAYFAMLDEGCPPEVARAVLPNATATEIVVTANLREWRHILSLRAAGTTGKPHPDMQALMVPVLIYFKFLMPEVFSDITEPASGNF